MPTVLVTTDLMTSSKVAGAAVRAGAPLAVAKNVDEAVSWATVEECRLVILDLEMRSVDAAELAKRLKEAPSPPWLMAFGPHVHEGRLAAAKEAGWDEVISRGEFHARTEEILRKHGG